MGPRANRARDGALRALKADAMRGARFRVERVGEEIALVNDGDEAALHARVEQVPGGNPNAFLFMAAERAEVGPGARWLVGLFVPDVGWIPVEQLQIRWQDSTGPQSVTVAIS